MTFDAILLQNYPLFLETLLAFSLLLDFTSDFSLLSFLPFFLPSFLPDYHVLPLCWGNIMLKK